MANGFYHHSARCPAIIQLFLDHNPLYGCFVSVPTDPTLRTTTYSLPQPLPPEKQITTTNLPMIRRSNTLAMRLADNIPRPTGNYVFKHEQVNEQKLFKYGKDRDPIKLIGSMFIILIFINATILAVLPDHCSNTVKKFIESLFIKHAEYQLNKVGRSINQHFAPDYSFRGQWYRGFTRRPSSFIIS